MNDNVNEVFKLITHGIYVISVKDDNRQNAFTAAWVMQVSFTPPMLAFSVNPQHYSWEILQSGGICAISVLSKEQMALAEHFGKSGVDKMAACSWLGSKTGAPVLKDSLAYFDCKVSHYADAGDHQLAICHVVNAGLLRKGIPMLYSDTGNMDGSREFYKNDAS